MNKKLQNQTVNNNHTNLINDLESSVYEYPTSTDKINALEFFLSNYDTCQKGYHCTLSNQAYRILLYLEKFHLVKKSVQINFFYRPSFTFNLTSYGIKFYSDISKSKICFN